VTISGYAAKRKHQTLQVIQHQRVKAPALRNSSAQRKGEFLWLCTQARRSVAKICFMRTSLLMDYE